MLKKLTQGLKVGLGAVAYSINAARKQCMRMKHCAKVCDRMVISQYQSPQECAEVCFPTQVEWKLQGLDYCSVRAATSHWWSPTSSGVCSRRDLFIPYICIQTRRLKRMGRWGRDLQEEMAARTANHEGHHTWGRRLQRGPLRREVSLVRFPQIHTHSLCPIHAFNARADRQTDRQGSGT